MRAPPPPEPNVRSRFPKGHQTLRMSESVAGRQLVFTRQQIATRKGTKQTKPNSQKMYRTRIQQGGGNGVTAL